MGDRGAVALRYVGEAMPASDRTRSFVKAGKFGRACEGFNVRA
jgi:hypothetical protein